MIGWSDDKIWGGGAGLCAVGGDNHSSQPHQKKELEKQEQEGKKMTREAAE